MLRFRDSWPPVPAPNDLNALAAVVLDPRHFHLAPGLSLQREHHAARTQRWEIHHGRLLDPAHTRQEQTFEEWNLYLVEDGQRSPGPLLSLKRDAAGLRLHVVRGVLCHAWEGYDAGGGTILSRETTRWVSELCGTIVLSELHGEALLDELVCIVFHAVVGASRLPLTSVETPLPQFSLGRLGYFFGGTAALNPLERIKWLETMLHATPAEEMSRLVDPLALLRGVFNEASLSPWTDLTDKSLLFLAALERQGFVTSSETVDFLTALVLQITRHLTAYDLITFHHRGANYPDALLLDVVLKALLRRVETDPDLFLAPEQLRRRRALRQGWLLRRSYEGLPVPDAPTSPGENVRVLPPPHVRVPEEQILQPTKRRRLLYADDPLPPYLGPHGTNALHLAVEELARPAELLELGLALFLDRPLGIAKQPGEPDQTVLLSHRAFSRSIAQRRLRQFADVAPLEDTLDALVVPGVPLAALAGQSRPGAVSVADARQAAEDFIFLSTTPATLRELFAQYDFSSIAPVMEERGVLLVPLAASGALTLHDRAMRPRVLLVPDFRDGYATRAGREVLRAGLQAVVLDDSAAEPVVVPLPPRIAGGVRNR